MNQHLYAPGSTDCLPQDECVRHARTDRKPVSGVIRRALERVVRAHRRKAAIIELSALSDRQLQDIGLERHRIPEVVDENLRAQKCRS